MLFLTPTFGSYQKERNLFKVNITKDNFRHRVISLTHELGRAASFLDNFQKIEIWFRRKESTASKGESSGSRQILLESFKRTLQANLGKVLLFAFRDIIFKKELYRQSQHDLSKLYVQAFNRCF